MNHTTKPTTKRERKIAVSYVTGELTMSELTAKLSKLNRLSGASVVARALRDLASENPSFAQLLKSLVNPSV